MNYIGIDLIEIPRIRKAVARWGERFLRRIYTESEIRLYAQKPQSLAARFAGKEAVMKLLGTGKRGISWRDIEIISHTSGKPVINLYGKAQCRADELRIKEIAISLSHSKEFAIASVSGNSEKESL